jgi:hypothetical protein
MKKIISISLFIISFVFLSSTTYASTRVSGYFRSNGRYVQTYYKSTPNYTKFDNYSTKGNYNPYTGKKGYANPYKW